MGEYRDQYAREALSDSLNRRAKRVTGTKQTTSRIERRVWGPGDTYLVVGERQVFEEEGFHEGQEVFVTISTDKPVTTTAPDPWADEAERLLDDFLNLTRPVHDARDLFFCAACGTEEEPGFGLKHASDCIWYAAERALEAHRARTTATAKPAGEQPGAPYRSEAGGAELYDHDGGD